MFMDILHKVVKGKFYSVMPEFITHFNYPACLCVNLSEDVQ